MSLTKQGDLDMLCGIYATINAIDCLISWNAVDRYALFNHIVGKLGTDGLLRVIQNGSGRNILSAIILKSAFEWIKKNKNRTIEAHKLKNQSKVDIEGVWNQLETFFVENNSMCSVIFGYEHISNISHWTCIDRVSKAQLNIKDGNIKRIHKSKFIIGSPTMEKPYSIKSSEIWMLKLQKHIL